MKTPRAVAIPALKLSAAPEYVETAGILEVPLALVMTDVVSCAATVVVVAAEVVATVVETAAVVVVESLVTTSGTKEV